MRAEMVGVAWDVTSGVVGGAGLGVAGSGILRGRLEVVNAGLAETTRVVGNHAACMAVRLACHGEQTSLKVQ